MRKMTATDLEAGLKATYDAAVNEPLPPVFEELLDRLDQGEPGAMGGKAPGSVPFAGGELAGL